MKGTFMGKTVVSVPLPSSGGLCIIQLLNVLENFDLKAMGHNSVEYIHVLSEAMKLVYADRSKYVGADTPDATVQALMSKEYAKYLASLIKMDSCLTPEAHDPLNFEHQDTTSFAVADKEGNIVCVTFTTNTEDAKWLLYSIVSSSHSLASNISLSWLVLGFFTSIDLS